ncbi:AraC family transcriptional regulator [Elizabethkingia anophelis]|nr:AraC family transcriptional regulator [Elizabethkingia anophelis]
MNHIITKLYEEPEYLNYKISYLADIGGFSSHSHFTQIFKKEVEISPSEFITQLKRNNSEQIIS